MKRDYEAKARWLARHVGNNIILHMMGKRIEITVKEEFIQELARELEQYCEIYDVINKNT